MTRSIKELASAGVVDIKDEEIALMLSEANPFAVIEEEAKNFRTREQIVIATAYMSLAAVGQGLGTCWIGAFDQDAVRAVLGIPETAKVIEVFTLGYPGDSPKAKTRKSLDEIICWEQWS